MGALVASEALAAHGGGHSGGHTGNFAGHSGHFGGGFAAPTRFVPRAVFYAAPVAYYPPAYYPPPPVYYTPPASYYPPAQPQAYYEPPRPAYPDAPRDFAPAQAPIYFCRDASGRTSVTNRKEDTIGKDCNTQSDQSSLPPRSAKGPYAAQDALRYRFFCPDSRKYYPEVNVCSSAWLKVVPDGAAGPR